MGIRILTGILKPKSDKQTGRATSHFNPKHKVTGHATGTELEEIGGSDGFINIPGKIVSLRQFRFRDDSVFATLADGELDPEVTEMFKIGDHNLDKVQMEVSWSCKGQSKIEEISYLIVGETRDEPHSHVTREELDNAVKVLVASTFKSRIDKFREELEAEPAVRALLERLSGDLPDRPGIPPE